MMFSWQALFPAFLVSAMVIPLNSVIAPHMDHAETRFLFRSSASSMAFARPCLWVKGKFESQERWRSTPLTQHARPQISRQGYARSAGLRMSEAPTIPAEAEKSDQASALGRLVADAVKTAVASWRQMDSVNDGDSSRSSGGTTWADGGWVDKALQAVLIDTLNSTVPAPGKWKWFKEAPQPFYVEVMSTEQVDIVMHFLPRGVSTVPWRRPTGSKVFAKALFGECDVIQMLGDPHGRFPMRQATRLKTTEDDVLLYLGGPPRVLGEATLDAPCAVLEVSLHSRQPMMGLGLSMKGYIPDAIGYEDARDVSKLRLTREQADALVVTREELPSALEALARAQSEGAADSEKGDISSRVLDGRGQDMTLAALRESIGGLDGEIDAIVRRALLTRQLPPGTMEELGVRHVKGILLHGPPGCGKTLTARMMAASLGASKTKVVAGPELLDKWVGEAERNVRALFWDAEREWKERGADSSLHVIILDELDSMARERGTLRGDSSGVRDSVVNQLLAIVDGVREMDNVLLIGLSNRKDLIEPALLRPGRLEVHLPINPPDAQGRADILHIHMRQLRAAGRLEEGAWEWAASAGMSERTQGMSGAELAGVVRGASASAIQRAVDQGVGRVGSEHVSVRVQDLELALQESLASSAEKPSWGRRVLRLPKKLWSRIPPKTR